MIAILYPLKMDKNLSEAYQKIYEVSAETALAASKGRDMQASKLKGPENTEKRKELRMKASQNYAKSVEKRKAGFVKNTATPQGPVSKKGMSEGTKDMKKFLDDKAKKLTKQRDAQPDAYKNNPHFDSTSPTSKSRTEAYDNRYSDNTGKESEEKKKKLEKKRGMKLDNHPQFKREGKYRAEWEELKLMEMDDYRESFDDWITSIAEEGYDIERWTDEEMIDTFISELNLHSVQESVYDALMTGGELQEGDKKGKGSGTKDACYHKVKSRYSVWPSAYASGALVKCRKAGASNWGNSSKKEEVEYDIDEGALVAAAKGVEKVGGAVVKGVKKVNRGIDKADKAVTKATMNRVVKPAAKAVGKAALETGKFAGKAALKTAKVAGRTAIGAVKGAAKGGYKAFRNQEDFSDWRDDLALLDEDQKRSEKFYAIAKKKGEQRRNSRYHKQHGSSVGKNERAAYNLSQASVSRNKDLDTQGGPQTGGGSKDFGYARNKSNPVKSKSVGDTGAIGHRKNRDEKVTMKKDGKTPLKTPRYKLSMGKRVDHHSSRRFELKNPDKNPKHEANKKKETKKEEYNYVNDYAVQLEKVGMIQTALKPITKAVTRQAIKVGGKTGGKIAQAGMRAAGTAVKDQVKNTAVSAGAGVVNKAAEKVRSIGKPKPKPQVNQLPPSQQTSM